MSGFDVGLGGIGILIVLTTSAITFILAYVYLSKRAGRRMNDFLINSLVHEQDQYIVFFDFESKVILANKSFEKLAGVDSKKLKKARLEDVIDDQALIDSFLEYNEDLISGRSSSIVYNAKVQKNGSSSWLQIEKRILKLDESKDKYILTLASNVSEKKMVESRLSDTQSEYGQLVDSASDIIFKTDLKGNFNFVNSIITETLGYSEAEFLSMNISDIVDERDKEKVDSFYENQLKERIPSTYIEFRAKTKSGGTKWLGQSVSFIKQHDEIVGFQSVTRDITATKETEDYLKKAKEIAEEANRTKDGFISSMSHEFRTPLNAILGYTQILEQSDNLKPDEKEQIGIIANSGEQLLSMVTDILELSNLDSDKSKMDAELVMLEPYIEELVSSFRNKAAEKKLSFDVKAVEDPAEAIEVDINKTSTILRNILTNAIKYTKKGGVTLKYQTESKDDKEYLTFEIIDTGIGISEEFIDKIFEPFWQSDNLKNYGTGLGLTLSKRLTEFLGGTISITSKSGVGTNVKIRIPVTIEHEIETGASDDESKETKVSAPAKRKKLRVLVVDDLQANRTVTRILLQDKGFEIKEAENGKEAIDMLESYKPQVILMDINMPVMDGIEATMTIRAQGGKFSDVPIIAITAGGFKADKKDLLNKGFSDYFLKPFKTEELIASIESFVKMDPFKEVKKQPEKSIDPEPEGVASYIMSLGDEKFQKVHSALKMQDLDSISNLSENPKFGNDMDDQNFKKLVSAANAYDYLFITKVLKNISDSNKITT